MQTIIPYANLHQEYVECKNKVDQAIQRCITNSAFINGPEVLAFEQAWCEYTGAEAVAGVSSGTSAIMLALSAVGVGPGDEVVVPSMSFISTAEAASQLGALPVFVDIDQYHTIDIDQVAGVITPRTKAIVFVDLYGQTINFAKLKSISQGLPLIQDAAQSSGCLYQGKPIGSHADLTCFSFYPGKNLSAMGDAGAVTGRYDLIERIRMLKDHGRKEKYRHEFMGWNERLDGIQAAIVSAKIPFLNTWNARRQLHASIYLNYLSSIPYVRLPKNNPVSSHVYNQFVIQTLQRDNLKTYLLERGIETGIQFPIGMHQQPVYNRNISLPITESLSKECLSLPVHAHLSLDNIEYVCKQIHNYFN
jgi:dTDP-4-amino-4,6-dideoxygalactose transaminase